MYTKFLSLLFPSYFTERKLMAVSVAKAKEEEYVAPSLY